MFEDRSALAAVGRTVTVPSRNAGHADHNVSIHRSSRAGLAGPVGTVYVTCDCGAGRSFWGNLRRGTFSPCYAMRTIAEVYRIVLPRRAWRG